MTIQKINKAVFETKSRKIKEKSQSVIKKKEHLIITEENKEIIRTNLKMSRIVERILVNQENPDGINQ